MAFWFSDTVTGHAELSVGLRSLRYLQCFFNTLGPGVGHPTADFPDNLSKAGWIQIGNEFASDDATVRIYWRDRLWLNAVAFEIQFDPQPGVTHFRYWLSAGCQAFLACED